MTLTEPQLQLCSTLADDGTLTLSLESKTPGPLADDEVWVAVQAAPINPSDLGLLLAGADLSTAKSEGEGSARKVTATVPAAALPLFAGRLGHTLPVGNEGAGEVVAAGASAEAQALLGRTVALFGGATYARYRRAKVADLLLLPEGTAAEAGASCFVNPLTALGMTETMRREGHRGIVHTAAASNLGQMLNRICLADGIPLVNVVRKAAQVELLKAQGATHVVNSTDPDFEAQLTDALAETGATVAFDATGGGELGSQLLNAMERAALRSADAYSRYGSTTYKQLYIYGGLDRSPTVLKRAFGFSWGIGGWLLPPFLERLGQEGADRLRARVVAELHSTFASHYAARITLSEALNVDTLKRYAQQATGEKFLITPHLA